MLVYDNLNNHDLKTLVLIISREDDKLVTRISSNA